MTLRMEAGLRPSRFERASVRDPTGSPVEINVSTMAVRISRSRFPMLGSAGMYVIYAISLREAVTEGRHDSQSILPNYFRCRRMGFGSKGDWADCKDGTGLCLHSFTLIS